jgi:VanZ family protein
MPIKKLLDRKAYTIAILITAFVTISSLVSLKGISSLSIKISHFDKIVHAISYFILALSWFFATQNDFKKKNFKVLLILLLISFGIIIEALQGGLTTYRQADFYDILANSIGVLVAAIFFKKLNLLFNSI